MKVDSIAQHPSSAMTGAIRRTLWRMKGPRRVISAAVYQRPTGGHELIVSFEDNENDVIETQFEPSEVRALVQRADALQQVLREKGLTTLSVPEDSR